jgi:shikimate dehydrogenase
MTARGMISGTTTLLAHFGYPTVGFRSPPIYNAWFARRGIDAVVVPMGVTADDFPAVLRAVFRLRNIRGALVTMPHKISTAALVDELSPAARIAGACNAVLLRANGSLLGEMFDGDGFVRAALAKGRQIAGARALVVGCGGVGSAIAASLAAAGVAGIMLFDAEPARAEALAERLCAYYPPLHIATGANDPARFDIVVNATPLGMQDGDPLPIDAGRLDPAAFVGDVVLRAQPTPLLRAARARGCAVQNGDAMLFEQIPAYLAFLGFGSATVEELRLDASRAC